MAGVEISSFCGICDFYKCGQCPYKERQAKIVQGGACGQPRIQGADLGYLTSSQVQVFVEGEGNKMFDRDDPNLAEALKYLAGRQGEMKRGLAMLQSSRVISRRSAVQSSGSGCGVANRLRQQVMERGME